MPQIYKIIMTNKSFGSQKGKKVLTSGIFKNVWIFQNATHARPNLSANQRVTRASKKIGERIDSFSNSVPRART